MEPPELADVLSVTASHLDRGKQGLLGREVFEEEGFGHTRRLCQGARGRAVKTLVSKDALSRMRDGGPPLFGRKFGMLVHGNRSARVSVHSLVSLSRTTDLRSFSFHRAREGGEYRTLP